MIRILLADDHDMTRLGVREMLGGYEGLSVCGEASNGREAVKLADELKPDIVLLDIDMPELSGIEATRQIKKILPATEVLIYTMHDAEQLIRRALVAGARGFVLKSDSYNKLIEAIEALANHKPFLNLKASETVLESFVKNAAESEEDTILTDREREIVQLLAEGKSNKEIASRLDISTRTVETHRRAIMNKLGVGSFAELVHYAIRNKIINV
jgi:DNA-binding NarL/FixJ family response regulator